MNEGKVINLLLLASTEKRPEMPAVLEAYKGALYDVHQLLSRLRDLLQEVDNEWPEEMRVRQDAEAAKVDSAIKARWRTCFEVISGKLFPV